MLRKAYLPATDERQETVEMPSPVRFLASSNEAHADGIAQRFHTPGDALQSIRIAGQRSHSVWGLLQAPQPLP
ncbi:hypothetical protein BI317_10425 [Xanthomonas hortorum pv. gardneri]|nr:hypothetical protein BI317_10425 [Xanthomonas hortorum pv. gardneri]ASW45627.1 hypothetical protein XJ27_06265 [Xanthomonas hortorum]EGD19352.1 hypothetical protein XGA_2008 [Xanthomonas hortorum ATCC 19865]KLB25574.1 hypothetical protein SM41311_03625 [Xanthomonas hortorum pv. gardneri]